MKYITVHPNPKNALRGIGHSFCCWLVPYILAQKYNLKFVHQDFTGDTDGTFSLPGSNAYQITRPVKEWNNFLNFGENELILNELPENISVNNIPYIPQDDAIYDHWIFKNEFNKPYRNNILYKISENNEGQFIGIDWNFYRNNDLKKKYNNSKLVKNSKSYFNAENIEVVVAIRRGDVTKNQQFRRWQDIEYYIDIIKNINNIKFNKPMKYHIYSHDMPKDEISQLKDLNMELHIDEDVFSTFYHFTKADIFVSGQGSFSLMANYLTDAIKITSPWYMFWNNFPKDIKDIIEVGEDGSFNKNKLMEAMV